MIKVVIIGPESTGKTELAKGLSKAYDAVWVPEYSRDYLTALDRPYEQKDLLEIAKGQQKWLTEKEQEKHALLISDTDMHVMKVWSDYKYGNTDPWILEALGRQDFDLYILTDYDIPYEDDPLRENPDERDYFFDIYLDLMRKGDHPFIIVKGDRETRLQQARQRIDTLL